MRTRVPDYASRPGRPSLTQPDEIQDERQTQLLQGGGNGGSHPHLVHHFLSGSNWPPDRDERRGGQANWTMVGICAHESASAGGERKRSQRLDDARRRQAKLTACRRCQGPPPANCRYHVIGRYGQEGRQPVFRRKWQTRWGASAREVCAPLTAARKKLGCPGPMNASVGAQHKRARRPARSLGSPSGASGVRHVGNSVRPGRRGCLRAVDAPPATPPPRTQQGTGLRGAEEVSGFDLLLLRDEMWTENRPRSAQECRVKLDLCSAPEKKGRTRDTSVRRSPARGRTMAGVGRRLRSGGDAFVTHRYRARGVVQSCDSSQPDRDVLLPQEGKRSNRKILVADAHDLGAQKSPVAIPGTLLPHPRRQARETQPALFPLKQSFDRLLGARPGGENQ